MSKGSKKRTRVNTYTNSKPRLRSSMVTKPLTTYEDLRRWSPPKAITTPRTFQQPSRIQFKPHIRLPNIKKPNLSKPQNLSKLISSFGFVHPKKVLICVRRKMRKQVLHAFNKTGKSGQRRPRRSPYSDIHC